MGGLNGVTAGQFDFSPFCENSKGWGRVVTVGKSTCFVMLDKSTRVQWLVVRCSFKHDKALISSIIILSPVFSTSAYKQIYYITYSILSLLLWIANG